MPNNPGMAAEEPSWGACVPGQCFKDALADRDNGLLLAYAAKLKAIRAIAPGSVWEDRASFLLGLAALEAGKPDEALFFLDEAGLQAVQDYVYLFKARAFALKKDFASSISNYDSVLSRFPVSVLRPEALFKKAELLFEAGGMSEARESFSRFVESYPKSPRVPEALLKVAAASVELNDMEAAVKTAKEIRVRFPFDPAAKGAQALVSKIKASGKEVPELTLQERFQMGERLYSATRYRSAAGEFEYVAGNSKGELRDRANIKQAMSLIRLKNYDRASEVLNSYLGYRNDANKEEEALYWLILIALRQGDEKALLAAEKKISDKFPKSEKRAAALVLAGKYYEGKKEFERGKVFFNTVVKEFKDTAHARDAAWSISWADYRALRYEEAYKYFTSLMDTGGAGFVYWAGKSAEKLGNVEEALKLYETACLKHPGTYYCDMAEARADFLKERADGRPVKADGEVETIRASFVEQAGVQPDEPLSADDLGDEEAGAGGTDAFDKTARPLYGEAHYIAAGELLFLGLGSYAGEEIEALTSAYSGDLQALKDLAGLFYKAGDYFRALKVYRKYFSNAGSTDFVTFGFPREFVERVKGKAVSEADPYLVAAVIREESSFNPRAISSTGALGLMQIMPSTGKLISKELKKNFSPDDLFDPDVNIRFGSWYLASLIKRFDNDMVLAIAGYNAGPNAVERWRTDLPQEADEFIESIPYTETRNYTKKVLKSYHEFLKVSGAGDKKVFMWGEKRPPAGLPEEVKSAGGINPG